MFTSSKSTIETLQKVSVFIVSFEQVNIGWDSAKNTENTTSHEV